MRGHIVRPFVIMLVIIALRRGSGKPAQQVTLHRRRGVLVDQQAGAGVAAEQGDEADGDPRPGEPVLHLAREVIQRLAVGGESEAGLVLVHVRGDSTGMRRNQPCTDPKLR